MTSCYLCKNSKSKEYTVRGFFDKSKFKGQQLEIPEEVDVHISCSLLFKETRLLQKNGFWEIRGLEDILKYSVFPCQCCSKPFDFRSRPFIVNCNYNECFDSNCTIKNKCSKHHCQFPLDLGCIYEFQIYDIIIENDPVGCRLKFYCMKHSQQKAKGFTIHQTQEWIMQKFFSNYQNQQNQNQHGYQNSQQQQQLGIPKSVEFQQAQKYDQNAYNKNQGQYYHQQQQQPNQQYGNTNQAPNGTQYKQGVVQPQQPQHGPQFAANQQNLNQQPFQKYNPSQQQIQQPQQHPSMNHPPTLPNPQQASGAQVLPQYEQYPKHNQQKLNQDYPPNQPQPHQVYDSQVHPVQQIPAPSPRIGYQGGPQGANNQGFDQNAVQTQVTANQADGGVYQGHNQIIPPPQKEDYLQQQQAKQQKSGVIPQNQLGNQIPKNTHPPQAWGQQPPQQLQSQQGGTQQNALGGFPNQRSGSVGAQYQNSKYGNYPAQNANIYQSQGYSEDKNQTPNQYNQPKQYQTGTQNNQDYSTNNNGQNAYQPFHPSQSSQRGFNSNYQSAQFADTGINNTNYNNTATNNNENYGNQMNYERQDGFQQNYNNQYNQQQTQQIQGVDATQGHDNTYSFTSNNPPIPNKQPTQDYPANPSNAQNTTNAPPGQPYTINALGRKIINPNVDTNPNGISVDITDQISIKRLQQQRKNQDQQQAQQQPVLGQATQQQQTPQFNENIPENPSFQRINSTVQPSPVIGPANAPPSDYRSANQQANPQNAIPKNPQQPQYYQSQHYPNPNSNQYPNQIPNQKQGAPNQGQQYPAQNSQGQYSQNYPPLQYPSSQGNMQKQQPPLQGNQQYPQQQPVKNMGNQVNNNVSLGVQNNGPFPPLQDKSRVQVPPNSHPSRQKSQQNVQNQQSQIEQGSNGANFGVPMYRRPSQQQQLYPPHQQPASYIAPNQQQQLQNNLPPQPQLNQNGLQSIAEQDNQMQIEEPNQQIASTATSTATTTTAPVTKKRAATKRGKKEQEIASNEATKFPDIPLKHTKSTQKKMDKRKNKKQNNMEEEEEQEGVPSSLPNNIDQQMKDESSTFQQPQILPQENAQIGQINNLPQQFGSENNIANRIESQESLDFKSQTSLGNQVQRQNIQIQKDSKFSQVQPINQKQNAFQQPFQANPPAQNMPLPPNMTKISTSQHQQTLERQPSQTQLPEQNQIVRHPSGPVMPNNMLPQQLNRPSKAQLFQQQPLQAPQPLKKKSGPLINENYKPYFVELVEIQSIIQRQHQQFQQQFLMRQQQYQADIMMQNQGFPNGQFKQQLLIPQQNSQGQISPHPQISGQFGQNIPYSMNQQMPKQQIQGIPPHGKFISPIQGQNGQQQQQQNLPPVINNQQQKMQQQNIPQHQFPQGNLNSLQNQGNKEINS